MSNTFDTFAEHELTVDTGFYQIELKQVGAQGAKGDAGSSGLGGTKGDAGVSGIQGAKGDTGASGARGLQGISGAPGQDGAGSISLTNPTFAYTDNALTSILYDDGKTKTFTYQDNNLTSLTTFNGTSTSTKNFYYDPSGVLTQITES